MGAIIAIYRPPFLISASAARCASDSPEARRPAAEGVTVNLAPAGNTATCGLDVAGA